VQQSESLTAAYGEAIMYGYLIEDMLKLHLFDCDYYHVNGYRRASKKPVQRLSFQELIAEFRSVYPKQRRFADAFNKIRLIRNKLAHLFIDQLGSDLETEEGRDQIHAMLLRAAGHFRAHLRALKRSHDALFCHAVKHALEAVLARDDKPFEAHVSASEIQQLLDELDELTKKT
jgi:hypothetical protein